MDNCPASWIKHFDGLREVAKKKAELQEKIARLNEEVQKKT